MLTFAAPIADAIHFIRDDQENTQYWSAQAEKEKYQTIFNY
jgi:hypothetical protein